MISDVDAMLAWVGFHKFHLRVALFALAMMLAAQTLRWAFIFAAPRILFSEFYIDYNVFTIRSLKYLISIPFLGVLGKPWITSVACEQQFSLFSELCSSPVYL